jgi:hypothetical protein
VSAALVISANLLNRLISFFLKNIGHDHGNITTDKASCNVNNSQRIILIIEASKAYNVGVINSHGNQQTSINTEQQQNEQPSKQTNH